MTLLLGAPAWGRRRTVLDGTSLAPLAAGIAADLETVLARPLHIPDEKAMLSRAGGRCADDGSLLTFDPFDPDHHRCPRCGSVHTGPEHRAFWRYWYHLWLAERAVHAGVLFRLRGDTRHRDLATAILAGYADRYLDYPNADNVLGPTRVFFSTYLESIWLLQLCIALDALEGADAAVGDRTGAVVRDRIIEPSARLIAEYDEGLSNRQVWNVAAQLAAARVLGGDARVQPLVDAPHGLVSLITRGCLSDGTWYEGENYHMFAHRGLWYGVTIAEAAGAVLAPHVVRRFDAGFAAPFLTALPDMTLPSRRDSQYAISLRQPRFAEACELGLARIDDDRLRSVLGSLYVPPADVGVGDNGRSRTSADVERNLPAMRLGRADLGWRALLFAREALPPLDAAPPGSALLEGQGIAVFRRDGGRVYAALDYGHSGGGHGHPDRLNVLLMRGAARILDDMGTGSYVERSLHWYRSTLAHNAPLVDGRSQRRADGELLAFEERGGAGWVRATVEGAAGGVRIDRTLAIMPGYLVDEVRWTADREVVFDLPQHAPLDADGPASWSPGTLQGDTGLEDGFEFVQDTERRVLLPGERITLRQSGIHGGVVCFMAADPAAELWRMSAPAAPGAGVHTFHLMRVRAREGRIRTVWSWGDDTVSVDFAEDVAIRRGDGTGERHAGSDDGWRIELHAGAARSTIDLGGAVRPPPGRDPGRAAAGGGNDLVSEARVPIVLPLRATLGADEYRRSERTWAEAGRPTAIIDVTGDRNGLDVRVRVMKADAIRFVPPGIENPLDNEVPEVNGDGIQLYVRTGAGSGAWTIVPVQGAPAPRAVRIRGWDDFPEPDGTWAPQAEGYEIRLRVRVPPDLAADVVHLGVIVNESAPGRARRRGQLVLGGMAGEWTYLRGDRHDPERLLPIRVAPDGLSF